MFISITLYKVPLTLSLGMKPNYKTVQMKATQQYVHFAPLITLSKVIITIDCG